MNCPEPLPCGDTSNPIDITLRDVSSGPVLVLEETAAAGCEWPRRVLRVVPGSFGACSLPEYQWYMDGTPILGAWFDTYEVPAGIAPGTYDFHYDVACPEALPCSSASAATRIIGTNACRIGPFS